MRGLFLFQRDLRLEDQMGLFQAMASSDELILSAVFDSKRHKLEIKAPYSFNVQERLGALMALEMSLEEKEIPICIAITDTVEWVLAICDAHAIEGVWLNEVMEPAFLEAYDALKIALDVRHISLHVCQDGIAVPKERVKNKSGEPYKVFTPFYKSWRSELNQGFLAPYVISWEHAPTFLSVNESFLEAANQWHKLKSEWPYPINSEKTYQERWIHFKNDVMKDYAINRDFPSVDGTSSLSAGINNGQISFRQLVRESREKPQGEAFLRQLAWRSFYQLIMFYFPEVETMAFLKDFRQLSWKNDAELLEKWKNGHTGFPIVDAAMRQLKSEGKMHNRLRMITASFLVKQLDIHWQIGEKYFYEMLRDGDLIANNGGWQWCASTGTDAQPYFRVFNPLRQAAVYDKEGAYASRWLGNTDSKTSSTDIDGSVYTSAPCVELKTAGEASKLKYHLAKKLIANVHN